MAKRFDCSVRSIKAVIYRDKLRQGSFEPIRRPKNYWRSADGKRDIESEALKYEKRSEFKNGSVCHYTAAQKIGILDQVCSHMRSVGNAKLRQVYLLKGWSDGKQCVYVGLTCDIKRRLTEHHIHESMSRVRVAWLSDFISANDAAILEKTLIERIEKGFSYDCLNSATGGSLGGNQTSLTKKQVVSIAMTCETPSEFISQHAAAYRYSKSNCFYGDLKFRKPRVKPNGYWLSKMGIKEAISLAKDSNSLQEYSRLNPSAVAALRKTGRLCEVFPHDSNKRQKKPQGHWLTEKGRIEAVRAASNYYQMKDYIADYSGAYACFRLTGEVDLIKQNLARKAS